VAAIVAFFGLPLAFVAELFGIDGAGLAALSGLSGIWLPIAAIGLLLFEVLFLPLTMILAANGLAFGWDKLGTYLWSRVMVYRKPRHPSHLDYQIIRGSSFDRAASPDAGARCGVSLPNAVLDSWVKLSGA
jgi:hypothetical protein